MRPFTLLFLCATAFAAPSAHLVLSLPGLSTMPSFKMYAGYVNIDPSHNKNIFYWFVESQRRPATDPLLFWTNGGPGASGLIGFLTEHGPFRPNPDGKTLFMNPYSWNRVASIVYFEAPVGVGFSFSDVASDITTDDARVAADNYNFITNWIRLFPEYAKNEVYLSGESYGGHYIPMLAAEILKRDSIGEINMAGLLIGNPLINADSFLLSRDPYADAWNFVTFMYSHGLLPHSAYVEAATQCNWDAYLSKCNVDEYKKPSIGCLDAIDICLEYIPRDIDVYDINSPMCLDSGLRYSVSWSPLSRFIKQRRSKLSAMGVVALNAGSSVDPCLDDYTVPYMNQEAVQAALHVRRTQWDTFGRLNYSEADQYVNMVPYFESLFRSAPKWRILVYSGDFDGCIPFTGTQKWISCLGRPVKTNWHSWHYNEQVAGSVVEYDRMSFITIKGAGHMVPFYLPPQGYAFFEAWIQGTPLV